MSALRENDPDWPPRALDLSAGIAKRSCFLLGLRQTGKTSLVRAMLKDARVHDLLDSTVYLALSHHPGRLAEELGPGLLPSIYFSDDPAADLQAYPGLYLQQEIVAEGATRNVPAFSRFLRIAALCNGTIVNFTNVASDAQVARTTVHEYFEILKDTLILHEVPAWRKTIERKPLASSRMRMGAGTPFPASSPRG